MKRIIILTVIAVMVMVTTGCGEETKETKRRHGNNEDVLVEGIIVEDIQVEEIHIEYIDDEYSLRTKKDSHKDATTCGSESEF